MPDSLPPVLYRSQRRNIGWNEQLLPEEVRILAGIRRKARPQLISDSAELVALKVRLLALEDLVRATAGSSRHLPEETCRLNDQAPHLPGFNYNRFVAALGPNPAMVAEIYTRYVPWFKGRQRVADLGSGRGMFLEVLRNHGIPAYGVDTDPMHVHSCNSRGLECRVGEALEHLAAIPPGSIDGIFMGHVIEHLPHAAKFQLVRLAFEKLAPGGVLAMETPNTRSAFVMSHVYYKDPTHQAPLHPDAYRFIFEDTGFQVLLSEFHMIPPGEEQPEQTSLMNYSLVVRK
jgi:2-polyprenyl-3-methyl-5-hydroxy-6-metoxy-1,4-benzoquinol methylase